MDLLTANVSVVCGVMDRLDHLSRSLPTWLACPEVAEVVLVDWSSKVSVPLHEDGRVRLVRVEGQQHWHPSKCHNLGVRLASHPVILRLDADVLLDTGFFAAHELVTPRSFYHLDLAGLDCTNEIHLAGVLYAARDVILGVGGYNERIVTYGFEDDDLFERLSAAGYESRYLDAHFLHHIPHTDEERVVNQDVSMFEGARPACFSWAWNLGVTHRSIAHNRELARAKPWSVTDRVATFVVGLEGRLLCCREVGTHVA